MLIDVSVSIKVSPDEPFETNRDRMAREAIQARLDYIADQLARKIAAALDSWPHDARHVEVIFKVS